ncbi:short-chain dehydrogenase [Bacillus mesophilum]|uniref:Short-chain dehydrogenase n=1 Tax=Bacillus mesophilum TaxID=1071718 RepID=A0A7V7RJP5_9BACI|nr:short-chain dehydrogenase [Bacillus mesophilum]KAB2331253.1 short-chain dehydrogenase [Bacillus mesophilum]
MPLVHEFGILDEFDQEKKYISYEPEQYNCVPIEDDLIQSVAADLSIMRTYFQSIKRPEFDLAMWGITLIPPESLPLFYEKVTSSKDFKESGDLADLAAKILQAIEDEKYMIHFGV